MVYLNPEAGRAIGLLIKELGCPAEVILTSESLIIRIGSCIAAPDIEKDTAKRRYNQPIECCGLSLRPKEWAEKLGVGTHVISYRMKRYGNPYGKDKPTDEDAMVVEES